MADQESLVTDEEWARMNTMQGDDIVGLYYGFKDAQLNIIEYERQLAADKTAVSNEIVNHNLPVHSQSLEWHHIIGTEAFRQILVNEPEIVIKGLIEMYGNLTNSRALTINLAHEALRNTLSIPDDSERELIMKDLDDKRRTYHRSRWLAGRPYIRELTN